MHNQVRYCRTSDGVRIAFTVDGEGPALLMCPSLVESFSEPTPQIERMHDAIGRGLTLVRYDMRGTGLSDRDVSDVSGPALARDLAAVVESAGLESVAIYGGALSGARAITFAVERPELVTHLVLFDTTADPEAFPRDSADALGNLARINWPLATQMLADMGTRARFNDPARRSEANEMILLSAQLLERASSGDFVAGMVEEAYRSWNVVDLLPRVRAKTLVFHHADNVLFPLSCARQLAADIPEAALVTLQGHTVGISNAPDLPDIIRKIHEFLGAEHAEPPPAPVPRDGGTAIILFTDIAGSAALTERLGDAAFRDAARSLDERLRAAIRDAGGTPVDGMLLGDGILATFSAASDAIRAARAAVALSADSELRLHIGLHAGDVIRESNNVFGGAVNIAARICGLCEPGEILVSQTVRDLARTSAGVAFEDRGEQALKGIEDPLRVFAIRRA